MNERRKNWKQVTREDSKNARERDRLLSEREEIREELRKPLVSFAVWDSLLAKLREITAKLFHLG